ncbi:non-hydrolyzing UDP-N-acetylglucosamine 2-epimerase [Paremcibacter congregatus]|uniref:non-hydrolyzing UDP-N-acetylglucosamine 2-epimerase n=1 Tax=Paremcibacter congregatus TaxID=2043170 RepID=UPI003A919408
MKILTVVGARPQFVKAATVSRVIQKHNNLNPDNLIEEKIVHTGQHYDSNMSDIFFEEMKIPKPAFTLGIGGTAHGAMTGRQLEKIEDILIIEQPHAVLVYGDTNSTLAGALAAVKLNIPVVHVEAGLRSFNLKMPEEINRILTDQISSILFCPTETAVKNLHAEALNQRSCTIHNVGDVMYDAAMLYAQNSVQPTQLTKVPNQFALLTIHRAENTNNLSRLKSIVEALNEISKDLPVLCPLHPRTVKVIKENGLELKARILEPVGYFEMIWLLKNCSVVLTDSGGLQKEAYFFKKPCITLRDQTEWVELVDAKANVLVGSDKKAIISAVRSFDYSQIDFSGKLYGDADASYKIVEQILFHKDELLSA